MKKMLYVNSDGSSYEVAIAPPGGDRIVELRFTENHLWNPEIRGKWAVDLEDHGNGVTIEFRDGKVLNLDYSEFAELEMLMTCLRKDAPEQWSRQFGFDYDRFELKVD